MKKLNCRRVFITLFCVALFCFLSPNSSVYADGMSVYNGLYLIEGEVDFTGAEINVSVENLQKSKVSASYSMKNNTEETQTLTLGVPITELEMDKYVSEFIFFPDDKSKRKGYKYNSSVVSGSKVNPMIDEVSVDFDNWRNYNVPLSLKPGETATAIVSYEIANKQESLGKILFDMDMNHLKTWSDNPENVQINVGFNAKSIKSYNFDNHFTVEPSEISPEYGYTWNRSGKDAFKEIGFNYYFVDEEIMNELRGAKSNHINMMISSFEKGEYAKAIEAGNSYITGSKDEDMQAKVYLIMADAYMALKNYDQALVVYELIETDMSGFGELEGKVREKILLNKVEAYRDMKKYEELYDLADYQLNYGDSNSYMNSWLEEQIGLIPENQLQKLREERKEPTATEKVMRRFMQGDFSVALLIGVALLIIVVVIIHNIRKKKKKDRFFY